ncbi:PIG-L family deacetylase [Bacillus sp. NP157]|nr:PIG-L family deacetylase [Bacillus sp. NP157]
MNRLPSLRPPLGYLHRMEKLPLFSPEAVLQGRSLLVIAPHPDDESLGVGGLLAAAARQGTSITVCFLTDGEASHVGSLTYPAVRLAQVRRQEALAALAALGVAEGNAHFLGLGDTHLGELAACQRDEICLRLAELTPSPALVCVTADTDPHADHQAASRLARSFAWPSGYTVMQYPVWTWCASPPQLPSGAPHGVRIDIRPLMARKHAAIAAHRSQLGAVVDDAQQAFEIEPNLLRHFLGPTETLLWPP